MDGTNIWKYMRYLMVALMTMTITMSTISCIDTSPLGPEQIIEPEEEETEPTPDIGD